MTLRTVVLSDDLDAQLVTANGNSDCPK